MAEATINNEMERETPKQIISRWLGVQEDEIRAKKEHHYGLPVFSTPNSSVAIALSEKEADKACIKAVKENLYTFSGTYIAETCDIELGNVIGPIIEKAIECAAESVNADLLLLVEHAIGLEEFTEAAIEDIGRGKILSSKDAAEHEFGGSYLYFV